ncbi:hypothetical protein [Hymenobacter elongatus]|uniref:Uncharacterized protein n=1 Tax=Hymenobacter elongatus TaxID=877208 RepID=A0A4Z0PR43_9BACT|nr:hypothetical protein [Hymenobacter elongatus]TGE19786.1 hypothetical protein E5J99_01410 [Hymenobacter elongatus]
MKRSYTTILSAVALLLGTGILGGCEKNKEAAPREKVVLGEQNARREDVVSEEMFGEVLEGAASMMTDQEHIFIKKADGGTIFSLVTDELVEPATEAKTVCSSKQVTWAFAGCVKNYVIANGCGMLQHGSNGWTLSNCPN